MASDAAGDPVPGARPLGAILAGGRARRFGGGAKAFARIGDRPIVVRLLEALEPAVAEMVIIANDPAPYQHLHLPVRRDTVLGVGPLAGVQAALAWAAERGRAGALVVACDMPFLPARLLRALAERARATRASAVVPASTHPRGIEPLCAYYGTAALPEVERRLDRGAYAMADLADALAAERLALGDVRRYGDPERLFFNVNDRAALERAEGILRTGMADP